jgi:hypothetical protein
MYHRVARASTRRPIKSHHVGLALHLTHASVLPASRLALIRTRALPALAGRERRRLRGRTRTRSALI